MFKQKKGALELSINAIVIIVLAMTLLGLGLGFIRSQFTSIGEIGTGVQEQIKQQILEDLRTGNKKLSFPTSEVHINRRDASVIAMGIKNLESREINFLISIQPIGTLEATEVNFRYQNESSDPSTFYPFILGPAESEVYPIRIETGTSTGTNTYAVRVDYAVKSTDCSTTVVGGWCKVESPYAQKTFFLTVQ